MEDKIFDLMTKFYSEFSEFRIETRDRFDRIDKRFEQVDKKFEQIDNRFDQVDKRFEQVDKRIDKLDEHIIRLENDLKNDTKALYDGYKQNQEGIEEIKVTVKAIAEKVDRHDIKIQVIEGGKRANG